MLSMRSPNSSLTGSWRTRYRPSLNQQDPGSEDDSQPRLSSRSGWRESNPHYPIPAFIQADLRFGASVTDRERSLVAGTKGSGYPGKLVIWARQTLRRTLQIIKRPGDLHDFRVLPLRRVAERTFGQAGLRICPMTAATPLPRLLKGRLHASDAGLVEQPGEDGVDAPAAPHRQARETAVPAPPTTG
jgi:hypothetical protein